MTKPPMTRIYAKIIVLLQKEPGSYHGILIQFSLSSIRKMQVQTFAKDMLDAGHQHGKFSVDCEVTHQRTRDSTKKSIFKLSWKFPKASMIELVKSMWTLSHPISVLEKMERNWPWLILGIPVFRPHDCQDKRGRHFSWLGPSKLLGTPIPLGKMIWNPLDMSWWWVIFNDKRNQSNDGRRLVFYRWR